MPRFSLIRFFFLSLLVLAFAIPSIRAQDDEDDVESVVEPKVAGEMPPEMVADAKKKLEEQIKKKMRQVEAEEELEEKEDLKFTHEFPNNPFGNVISGEATLLQINVTNIGIKPYTILGMAGVLVNPNNFSQVLRNLSAYRYDTLVEPEKTESLPYYFRIDTDPTEWGVVIVVEYYDSNNVTYRGLAYRDTIKVVEPELKFWEPQMLFLYALLAGLAYLAFFFIRDSLFPEQKKKKTVKVASAGPVTAEAVHAARGNVGGKVTVENEWIPKHVKEVHGSTARGNSPSPKQGKKRN